MTDSKTELQIVQTASQWETLEPGTAVVIEGDLVAIDMDFVMLDISEGERVCILIEPGVVFMLDLFNESMMVGAKRRIEAKSTATGWTTSTADVMQMKPRAGLYPPSEPLGPDLIVPVA